MNELQSILVTDNSESHGLSADAHRKHKRMKEMQGELDRMKSGFAAIANAFHELRTPLHSTRGFIKLMLDGKVPDSKTQREFLALMDEQSQHLSNLVVGILDVAAIESEQIVFEKQDVSMKEIIDKVVDKLQKLATEKDVAIEAYLPYALPHIEGDFEKLEQAVTNLLDNAIESSPEQGNVLITARAGSNDVLVQIIDQNIGADAVPPLSQKSPKRDSSTAWTNDSTGVGLYLAKRIIEAHGGQIWAEDKKPGTGNTLSFAIPKSPDYMDITRHQVNAMIRDVFGHGLAVGKAEPMIPVSEQDFSELSKTNAKRRPVNLKDKSLLLRLDESEWDSFMSVSFQLGVTPSLLARALLKKAMSRYSHGERLDDLFLLFTSPAPAKTPLSRREMEILNLMTQGSSNSEIASAFGVAEKTIKNHITSILRKLEANNRTHAVVLALRHNLIEPGIPVTQEIPAASSLAGRKAKSKIRANNHAKYVGAEGIRGGR